MSKDGRDLFPPRITAEDTREWPELNGPTLVEQQMLREWMAGYHVDNIPKGVLGRSSKITEELAELIDAEKQGVRIMVAVELSDLYGAIEAFALTQGLTMDDLKNMSNVTKRAFQNGTRK